MTLAKPDLRRLLAKVRSDQRGCWLWLGHTGTQGYGVAYTRPAGKNKAHSAHRVVYEYLVGPIPEGLQLDHLCRVRNCVNPDHLEPVTNRENTIRGIAAEVNARRYAEMAACNNGHPRSPENVRLTEHGHRECRACSRATWRRLNPDATPRGTRRAIVRWESQTVMVMACGHRKTSSNRRKGYATGLCLACDITLPNTHELTGGIEATEAAA